MEKLKERITENGIDYILVGDYYIPDLKLPEEDRPIGRFGRLHREYLKQEHPARYSSLILTGKLWTYLADLNEQAEEFGKIPKKYHIECESSLPDGKIMIRLFEYDR